MRAVQPAGQEKPARQAPRWSQYYRYLMNTAAVVMMAGIVIIMNVEIVYRYVLNDSLIWAGAVCRYLMVWMTFLLLGPAFQNGEFVAVEFIVKKVPPVLRLVLIAVAYGGSIVLLATISYYGYYFASMNSIQTVPAFDFIWSAIEHKSVSSGISMFWIYISVPVGCSILAVQMVLAIVEEVIKFMTQQSESA